MKTRKTVTTREIARVTAYKDDGLKRWQIAQRMRISQNRVEYIIRHYCRFTT